MRVAMRSRRRAYTAEGGRIALKTGAVIGTPRHRRARAENAGDGRDRDAEGALLENAIDSIACMAARRMP